MSSEVANPVISLNSQLESAKRSVQLAAGLTSRMREISSSFEQDYDSYAPVTDSSKRSWNCNYGRDSALLQARDDCGASLRGGKKYIRNKGKMRLTRSTPSHTLVRALPFSVTSLDDPGHSARLLDRRIASHTPPNRIEFTRTMSQRNGYSGPDMHQYTAPPRPQYTHDHARPQSPGFASSQQSLQYPADQYAAQGYPDQSYDQSYDQTYDNGGYSTSTTALNHQISHAQPSYPPLPSPQISNYPYGQSPQQQYFQQQQQYQQQQY